MVPQVQEDTCAELGEETHWITLSSVNLTLSGLEVSCVTVCNILYIPSRGVTIHFNSDKIRITNRYMVDDTIHGRYSLILAIRFDSIQ